MKGDSRATKTLDSKQCDTAISRRKIYLHIPLIQKLVIATILKDREGDKSRRTGQGKWKMEKKHIEQEEYCRNCHRRHENISTIYIYLRGIELLLFVGKLSTHEIFLDKRKNNSDI